MLVNKTYPACYLFHDTPNLLNAKRADEIRDKRWSHLSYEWRRLNRLAVHVVFQVPVAKFHVDGVQVVRIRREVPMVKNMDNIWVCFSFAKLCDSSGFSLDILLCNERVKYLPCENLLSKHTRGKGSDLSGRDAIHLYQSQKLRTGTNLVHVTKTTATNLPLVLEVRITTSCINESCHVYVAHGDGIALSLMRLWYQRLRAYAPFIGKRTSVIPPISVRDVSRHAHENKHDR
jgi:hypothetical protein